jgi:hypothetical protein
MSSALLLKTVEKPRLPDFTPRKGVARLGVVWVFDISLIFSFPLSQCINMLVLSTIYDLCATVNGPEYVTRPNQKIANAVFFASRTPNCLRYGTPVTTLLDEGCEAIRTDFSNKSKEPAGNGGGEHVTSPSFDRAVNASSF